MSVAILTDDKFTFSPQMEARIAAGDFTREQVEKATQLLHNQSLALSDGDIEALKDTWKTHIKMGADINYVILPTSSTGVSRDLISKIVKREVNDHSASCERLKAAIELGARPHKKTLPLFYTFDGNSNADNVKTLSTLLLSVGAGYLIGKDEQSNNNITFSPDASGPIYLLHDDCLEYTKCLSQRIAIRGDVDDVLKEFVDFDLLEEMASRGDKAKNTLMQHADADRPVHEAGLDDDDMLCLLTRGWHFKPDVAHALTKDYTMFRDIENRYPVYSADLTFKAHDYTAEFAKTTISGPAKGWSAVAAETGVER